MHVLMKFNAICTNIKNNNAISIFRIGVCSILLAHELLLFNTHYLHYFVHTSNNNSNAFVITNIDVHCVISLIIVCILIQIARIK